MIAIGFICTPADSFANDYTWPPRENAPVLTLLGPVYEIGLELESELTIILAGSLKILANSPECCLPESYIDAWFKDAAGNVSSRSTTSIFCSQWGCN